MEASDNRVLPTAPSTAWPRCCGAINCVPDALLVSERPIQIHQGAAEWWLHRWTPASRASDKLLLEPNRSLVLPCTRCQERADGCVHRSDTHHFVARALRPWSIHSGPSTTVGGACIAACKERSVLASARSSLFKCFGPIKAMLGLSACAADTTRSSHRCRK